MTWRRSKVLDLLGSTGPGRWTLQALNRRRIDTWRKKGCPFRTPHAYKQSLVCDYARRFGLRVFVETGTQYGDMVFGVMKHFEHLYSIELDPDLFAFCLKRFASAPHVALVQGDSAEKTGEILAEIQTDVLFWLDAHYFRYGRSARGPKETPVLEELEAILSQRDRRHVILVDDAHCFIPGRGFPSLETLRDFVSKTGNDLSFTVLHDVIRILPERMDPGGRTMRTLP